MPLPMVLATAVPKTKAAMKFQKAAQSTARKGVRTRVETTVAMELAASCQPFENSKARVRKTVINTRANRLTGSGVLQDDALDHIRDVFTLVNGGFNHFKNLFPLDDLNGVFFFLKELGDQGAADPVAFILQAIDFDDVLQGLVGRFHGVDGAGKLNRGGGKDFDELYRARTHEVDAIEDEAAGGGVDQVDDVVHGAAEFVHVLAVEGGDEGLIEFAENLVGDFVTLVLDGLHSLDLLGDASVVLQHAGKSIGAADDVFGLFAEEDEEIPIARHEALQESGHVTRSPLRSKSVAGQVYRRRGKGARKGSRRTGRGRGQGV